MNRQQSFKQAKQALNHLWQRLPAKVLAVLMAAMLIGGNAGCSRSGEGPSLAAFNPQRSRLAEVSPPFTIQTLKQSFEANQPQVEILSPKLGQVFEATNVVVKLRVKDLALYKDEDLGLGPYLQLLLDNQPSHQIYDASQPLTLENLTPGTHTIRAFAVQPWHESFKNEGAFAQTTFHIFTKTPENNPDPSQPLLTYNYPQGTYGAEPVLLDFFLTNAPLHLVAREDSQDAIPDWQVRCTINGESFTFDRWEPIYLKGLKPGTSWVKLELLDEKGQPLPNVFNQSVQLVTYEPGGSDTLAQLTRGELTADAARKIVDPNYLPPVVVPEPEPEPIELQTEPEPEPNLPPDLPPDLTKELPPAAIPPEIIAPTRIEPIQELPTELEPPAPLEDLKPPALTPLKLQPSPEAAPPKAPLKLSPSPVLSPSISEPPAAPEFDRAAIQAEFKAMQNKLNQVLQPNVPTDLRPVAPLPNAARTKLDATPITPRRDFSLPKFAKPEPAQVTQPSVTQSIPQPVLVPPKLVDQQPLPEVSPLPSSSDSSPTLLTPFAELTRETAPSDSTKPRMLDALDRVKSFFEGLRKRPTEEGIPLFASPKPDSSLSPTNLSPGLSPSPSPSNVAPEDATIIDSLMEALPDSLRRPLMEELVNGTSGTPIASPASPN